MKILGASLNPTHPPRYATGQEVGWTGKVDSGQYLDAVEIVDREDRAPLILVAEEAEPLRLPTVLVAHQIQVHHFPVPTNGTARCSCQNGVQLDLPLKSIVRAIQSA